MTSSIAPLQAPGVENSAEKQPKRKLPVPQRGREGHRDRPRHRPKAGADAAITVAKNSQQPPELPDASRSGDKQPCWKLREEIGKAVTQAFVGGFNENGDWQIRFPSGLGTDDMTRVMESLGATRFYKNLDVIAHGVKSLPFISGSHWEIMNLGDWYHFIFLHGTISDLELAEFRYEKFRPSSNAHIQDVAKTLGKTSGEIPCDYP